MNNRSWKVLCWNVRGLNSDNKWNAVRDRIVESFCDIVCLQETKREHFDLNYIRLFCPPTFDSYVYLPSVGASGGTIILWKSAFFQGKQIFQNSYATSVEFTSLYNGAVWILTNIYAPCTPNGKRDFLNWFKHINMPDIFDWLIVGDFNLYRNPEDRNKDGADYAEMLLFNEAISKLGLVELPLKGKRFTWSNKQLSPLLERLDWFFTSPC
jgi:exonuclease III